MQLLVVMLSVNVIPRGYFNNVDSHTLLLLILLPIFYYMSVIGRRSVDSIRQWKAEEAWHIEEYQRIQVHLYIWRQIAADAKRGLYYADVMDVSYVEALLYLKRYSYLHIGYYQFRLTLLQELYQ
jgi:hypothetical protein